MLGHGLVIVIMKLISCMLYFNNNIRGGGNIMPETLTLHVLEKDDLPFLHRLYNNTDIMRYWFEEPYCSLAQLEDMFNKSIRSEHVRQFILKKDSEKLGYIGFYNIERIHRKAEFGIMIDPKYQGKGFASIAMELAIDYAFSTLNLHKFYLIVDKENEKAIHIYKKAGFQVEAELKDEFFVNGSYHDVFMMSIFQSEYMQSKQV